MTNWECGGLFIILFSCLELEYCIFGEGSNILTNQKQESSDFSQVLIGLNSIPNVYSDW